MVDFNVNAPSPTPSINSNNLDFNANLQREFTSALSGTTGQTLNSTNLRHNPVIPNPALLPDASSANISSLPDTTPENIPATLPDTSSIPNHTPLPIPVTARPTFTDSLADFHLHLEQTTNDMRANFPNVWGLRNDVRT